jgi:hypothetical protein
MFSLKRSSFVWVEINLLFVTTKSPNFSTKRNTTTYTQGEQENQTHRIRLKGKLMDDRYIYLI